MTHFLTRKINDMSANTPILFFVFHLIMTLWFKKQTRLWR